MEGKMRRGKTEAWRQTGWQGTDASGATWGRQRSTIAAIVCVCVCMGPSVGRVAVGRRTRARCTCACLCARANDTRNASLPTGRACV
ncbi:unnamed protein product [Toxocara canis]|uniref:Uncharacterized protein n=1 Tax=Toxocara canis TaxID=6265 RepID=A0A183V775_TOXCA|nr:unnamed protein product [Toxocara canis]